MTVLVLIPAGIQAPPLPRDAALVAFATPADAAAILAADGSPTVILSDALAPAAQETLAAALRARPRPCIEVRGERWDGHSPSPLSAVCRGVISGFGVASIVTAIGLLP